MAVLAVLGPKKQLDMFEIGFIQKVFEKDPIHQGTVVVLVDRSQMKEPANDFTDLIRVLCETSKISHYILHCHYSNDPHAEDSGLLNAMIAAEAAVVFTQPGDPFLAKSIAKFKGAKKQVLAISMLIA